MQRQNFEENRNRFFQVVHDIVTILMALVYGLMLYQILVGASIH
jgi:hypothetical protein